MSLADLNISPENMSRMMKTANGHRKSPTLAESHVIELLKELKEKYYFEKGFLSNRTFFIVDFYFPKPRKLCLEVDGGYHKTRVLYDAQRDEFLREKRKMKVLRITNEVALSLNAPELLALLNSQ